MYGPFDKYNSFDFAVDILAGVLDSLGTAEAKYADLADFSLDPEMCMSAARLCDYVGKEICTAMSAFRDVSENIHVDNFSKQHELYKKLTEPYRRAGIIEGENEAS